jgi:hypothetical protein
MGTQWPLWCLMDKSSLVDNPEADYLKGNMSEQDKLHKLPVPSYL